MERVSLMTNLIKFLDLKIPHVWFEGVRLLLLVWAREPINELWFSALESLKFVSWYLEFIFGEMNLY